MHKKIITKTWTQLPLIGSILPPPGGPLSLIAEEECVAPFLEFFCIFGHMCVTVVLFFGGFFLLVGILAKEK